MKKKKRVYVVKGIVKGAQLGCVKNPVGKATGWPKKMKSTYMKDLSSLPAKCLELHNLQVRYMATTNHLQGHSRASGRGIGFRGPGGVRPGYGQ